MKSIFISYVLIFCLLIDGCVLLEDEVLVNQSPLNNISTNRTNDDDMFILTPSLTTLTGVTLLVFVLYQYIRYTRLKSYSEQDTSYLKEPN